MDGSWLLNNCDYINSKPTLTDKHTYTIWKISN